jgi:hypothetical protein
MSEQPKDYFQEHMQMLANTHARATRTAEVGTIKDAIDPYKYQRQANEARRPYSSGEAALAQMTEGQADPGDLSKMPQAYDPGTHQKAANDANLQSWEIEKQMERERLLGNQVK